MRARNMCICAYSLPAKTANIQDYYANALSVV